MIQFLNNFSGFRLQHKQVIADWLAKTAQNEGKAIANIQYVFCSDAEILEINKTFLKHNYYTDIITFDYSQNNDLEAEIYISIETVRSNAMLFHVKPAEELNRVIVHGLLHLTGYNDKTKQEAGIMRNKENECLNELNKLLLKQKVKKNRKLNPQGFENLAGLNVVSRGTKDVKTKKNV